MLLRFRGGSRGGKGFGSFGATVPENGSPKVGAAHGPRHSLCSFPEDLPTLLFSFIGLSGSFSGSYAGCFFDRGKPLAVSFTPFKNLVPLSSDDRLLPNPSGFFFF